MLCDFCHQEEAIIHIQEIRPDGNKTFNLCAKCALANFSKLHPGFDNIESVFNRILGMFEGKDAKVRLEDIFNREPEKPEFEENLECPNCHLKLSDFAKSKRLRCSQCARTFADYMRTYLERQLNTELAPLNATVTESSQAGSMASPKPADPEKLKNDELARLRRELEYAIKVEDYEKAASLRDLIAEYTPISEPPQE